jgi:hypothetical protein
MRGVAAVPVREAGQPRPAHGVEIPGVGWADPQWLMHLRKETLGPALLVTPPASLAVVEDCLTDLLALTDLLTTSPMPPLSPAGPITYPRWGDIYWVRGQDTGGQNKRYVVVSHDHHNATGVRPFLVRTTSQAKRNVQDFPPIQGGDAHACCGDVMTINPAQVELRRRPTPHAVNTGDMTDVARSLASVLDLEDAVVRQGGIL